MDFTTRLALNKPNPDPVTGDFVDVAKLNDNADKIDAAISTTVCTSATRPASPFQGQAIWETDTGRLYIWTGTEWIGIPQQGGSGRSFPSFIDFEGATAATGNITGKVVGDSIARLVIYNDGKIEMGSGSASRDTNLYRGGTNLLKTDDALTVTGALNANLVAVKSLSEVVNNSAVLQADDHLFIAVEANATYLLDSDIIYNSPTGNDITVQWSGPTGASMEWCSWAPSAAHTGSPAYEGILKFESRNITQTQAWGGTGAIVHAMPRGCLQTSVTPGTLQFNWAQSAAGAVDTTVYAKSWIRLHRVA